MQIILIYARMTENEIRDLSESTIQLVEQHNATCYVIDNKIKC